MKLLLDTHTFLWMDTDPAKLSSTASSWVADPANSIAISVASLWEIQIKAMLGKLTLRIPLPQLVSDQQQQNGLVVIPVTERQVYAVSGLPNIHTDPFDRLIAAVSRLEGLTLLSADPVFRQYPVSLAW